MNDLHDTDAYRWFQDGSPGSAGDEFDDKIAYVWNSETIGNQALTTLDTPGPRPLYRGHWQPVGYTSPEAGFHTYAVHFKSGGSGRDEQIRGQEASALRADADQLNPGANFIFGGDFNLSDTDQPAFQTITASGTGQGIDPLGGSFSKFTHTQNARFSMSRRLDFQFLSPLLIDQQGLDIIPGSYHAFGNNSTHTTGQPITTGSGAPPEVLQALIDASDHLPVVADFRLPARLAADAAILTDGEPTNRVIADTALALGVDVTNTAPVQVAAGAETLDYAVVGASPNVLSGAQFGSAQPLAGPATETLIALSGQPGQQSATVQVNSNNQGLNESTLTREVTWTSLHHATGSFASDAEMATTSIDFGPVTEGAAPVTQTFDLFNRVGEAGAAFTSAMFTGSPVAVSGDTDQLMLLETLTEVAAGESTTLTAAFDPAAAGNRTAVWHLPVRDEDLPGAMTELLEITLTGSVTPAFIPGDLDGNGVVDGLDIDPFVQALTDENAFDAAADMDGNDVVDGLDIDPFVQALTSSDNVAGLAVPEPGSLALLGLGGLALLRSRPGQARA